MKRFQADFVNGRPVRICAELHATGLSKVHLVASCVASFANLNGNVFVDFDLVELESGARVSLQPLWVAGPNADAGPLVVENCDVIAQMLRRAGLETAGNVGELIPKLAGLEFGARLTIYPDSRTGRTFNLIAAIIPEDAP